MKMTDAAFTGSIPALYDSQLGPLIFEPYAEDLAARIGGLDVGHVLETAAGTGILTRQLVARLPAGVKVTATDLNQPMLDFARGVLASDRVVWRQADATSLPFPDQSFDAVVCQFGVMFFPDRRKAYAEARRVLKPGGRFHFNCWDGLASNVFPAVVLEALTEMFADDPPSFMARVPHGYHDTEAIGADLRAAGFSDIGFELVMRQSHATSARQPAVGFCQGTPMRQEIEVRGPGRLAEATDRAEAKLRQRFGDGQISGKIQAYVVTAAG